MKLKSIFGINELKTVSRTVDDIDSAKVTVKKQKEKK